MKLIVQAQLEYEPNPAASRAAQLRRLHGALRAIPSEANCGEPDNRDPEYPYEGDYAWGIEDADPARFNGYRVVVDDDTAVYHFGTVAGALERLGEMARAAEPKFKKGQRVTVARIEATSDGDMMGPFSGVVIGGPNGPERSVPPRWDYTVQVIRHDQPGKEGFHIGEYLIDEADLTPA